MNIDRYTIREVLGRGAMSNVYRAWDPKLHRDVAIKVVYREVSIDAKSRERFHREARAVAALRHPNIVEIYDYSGTESQLLYLVMELLDGEDLYEVTAKAGPMPEPIAAAVGHELCRALQTAHQAGVIHRDIKPENVIVSRDGRVVLTDFGGVKAFQEHSAVADHDQKTDIVGTPGFMPPEQIRQTGLGPYTDIFALGVLLYNIATGELPYKGDAYLAALEAVVDSRIVDPRERMPNLSARFCAILERCLASKPNQRYASAAELRDALKDVLAAHGVVDLRDDLQDYIQDPSAHNAATHLVPPAEIAYATSGGLSWSDSVGNGGTVNSPQTWIKHISPPARGVLYGALLLVVALLAGYGYYFLLRPAPMLLDVNLPPSAAVSPTQDPVNPATLLYGKVRLELRGGPAQIIVDGIRRGRIKRAGLLSLPTGKHNIEVRGRGKRLKVDVDVSASETGVIKADLRRGRISSP